MSQDQNIASPAERFLIRENIESGGNPNSMLNLNTAELPNGALCMVSSTGTLYQIDKSASSGGIAPESGPGRWRVLTVSDALAGPAMVVSTGFNSYAVDGNWHQTSSSNTALDAASDAAAWALTPLGCALAYSGPARSFIATVIASARVTDASAARDVFLGIGHNADLTGAPTAGTSGEVDAVIPTAAADVCIVSSRLITMAPGDIISPKMAGPAAATGLSAMLRLVVTPA